MSIREELSSDYPLSINREALLSLIKTSSLLMRLSDRFFSPYGTTDIQFNILMILKNGPASGLSQQELSERLVVTKSNVVGLIDRMEKQGLVKRNAHPEDRRLNQIIITAKGKKLLQQVEGDYTREVDDLMSCLGLEEKKAMIQATAKIRQHLKRKEALL